MELTEAEKEAKEYMIRMVKLSTSKPCNIANEDQQSTGATLPVWYDELKYKRGQKYFFDNRFGMLTSNMCGLLTLLAEPKGLKILSSTGRSSTPETARKRYVSTTLHMLSWYETDLSPGSQSWTSLNRVRKMHFAASNAAKAKEIGFITQGEVALTTFGFMGFALIRPHLLGIRHDCAEDREAFIHFWAVMGHMLGVEDTFNMCLHSIETVSIICQIMLRYIFIPLIQFESPTFRQMVTALFEGMSQFLPHMTYDIQMFTAKRVIGVPGYQYNVDISKECLCRAIFTEPELEDMRQHIFRQTGYEYADMTFGNGIPLVEIRRGSNSAIVLMEREDEKLNVAGKWTKMDEEEVDGKTMNVKGDSTHKWAKLLGLDDPKQLVVTVLRPDDNDRDGWTKYLNDSKFGELSKGDQVVVRMGCRFAVWLNYRLGRFILESGLSMMLYFMRKWHKTKMAVQIERRG